MYGYEFYIDPSRCIGCRSCLQACEECETHRGKSMINFDFIERRESITSAAYVCWHCDEPTCAQVCPADAIKKGEDGIVHSSEAALHRLQQLRARVPVRYPEDDGTRAADDEVRYCYDRTSVGKRPMCATVCPSQALAYVRPEDIAKRQEKPTNIFYFGEQKITTKVFMMAPAERDAIALDIVDYMWEEQHELAATIE